MQLKIIYFLILLVINVFGNKSNLNTFTISKEVLHDKIKGGWLGKIAGVCIGTPTEFKAKGCMYDKKINFNPLFWRAFIQDDLYVQTLFVKKMDALSTEDIFNLTMLDYGNALRDARFLPGYNNAGKEAHRLLKKGVNPPFSGMCAGPSSTFTVSSDDSEKCYNKYANNLDWQISCDWIGLMCPAMPMSAIRLNDTVGHVMSYADGLYGGYFISSMISFAFKYSYNPDTVQDTIYAIVKKALLTLPKETPYYRMVNDVINFKENNPQKNYEDCWLYINDKYMQIAQDDNILDDICFAASFNGAFIVIGLLYGNGDIEKTIEITIRCGQDSDCNPGNAGTVIGTLYGFKNIPKKWRNNIKMFSFLPFLYSGYSYNRLIKSSFERADKLTISKNGTCLNGIYSIKVEEPESPLIIERYGQTSIVKYEEQRKGANLIE